MSHSETVPISGCLGQQLDCQPWLEICFTFPICRMGKGQALFRVTVGCKSQAFGEERAKERHSLSQGALDSRPFFPATSWEA